MLLCEVSGENKPYKTLNYPYFTHHVLQMANKISNAKENKYEDYMVGAGRSAV